MNNFKYRAVPKRHVFWTYFFLAQNIGNPSNSGLPTYICQVIISFRTLHFTEALNRINSATFILSKIVNLSKIIQ